MASIKEILDFELSRDGAEIQRSIHLFQEGSFYRAYEWSAWLVCRYIHEFKVTHRKLKGVEQSVAFIGFPVTSLGKWVGENIERHDVADKHILLRLAEDVFSDLGGEESMEEVFVNWKSQQPLVEKPTKTGVVAAKPLPAVISLSVVAQRIMAFPIEKKSPIECYQFISEIKQQLAMLY